MAGSFWLAGDLEELEWSQQCRKGEDCRLCSDLTGYGSITPGVCRGCEPSGSSASAGIGLSGSGKIQVLRPGFALNQKEHGQSLPASHGVDRVNSLNEYSRDSLAP